jgi:hypothetical protein
VKTKIAAWKKRESEIWLEALEEAGRAIEGLRESTPELSKKDARKILIEAINTY